MAASNWERGGCFCVTDHLLGHLLGHVFVELEEELDGVVVLVLPVELLCVVHAQPQLQTGLHHIVLLCQLHVHAIVLLEEGVIQEVLNGVPAEIMSQPGARISSNIPGPVCIYTQCLI